MQTRRVTSLLVIAAASAAVLSGCVYDAEPAPGSAPNPNVFSTEGFPPPGPATSCRRSRSTERRLAYKFFS